MTSPSRMPHACLRWCEQCKALLDGEIGRLCAVCCEKQAKLPISYVMSTLAARIGQIRKLEDAGAPMGEPLRSALETMARAYDALAPRINAVQLGRVIELAPGTVYAYPEETSEELGPFQSTDEANWALLDRALERQPADRKVATDG